MQRVDLILIVKLMYFQSIIVIPVFFLSCQSITSRIIKRMICLNTCPLNYIWIHYVLIRSCAFSLLTCHICRFSFQLIMSINLPLINIYEKCFFGKIELLLLTRLVLAASFKIKGNFPIGTNSTSSDIKKHKSFHEYCKCRQAGVSSELYIFCILHFKYK